MVAIAIPKRSELENPDIRTLTANLTLPVSARYLQEISTATGGFVVTVNANQSVEIVNTGSVSFSVSGAGFANQPVSGGESLRVTYDNETAQHTLRRESQTLVSSVASVAALRALKSSEMAATVEVRSRATIGDTPAFRVRYLGATGSDDDLTVFQVADSHYMKVVEGTRITPEMGGAFGAASLAAAVTAGDVSAVVNKMIGLYETRAYPVGSDKEKWYYCPNGLNPIDYGGRGFDFHGNLVINDDTGTAIQISRNSGSTDREPMYIGGVYTRSWATNPAWRTQNHITAKLTKTTYVGHLIAAGVDSGDIDVGIQVTDANLFDIRCQNINGFTIGMLFDGKLGYVARSSSFVDSMVNNRICYAFLSRTSEDGWVNENTDHQCRNAAVASNIDPGGRDVVAMWVGNAAPLVGHTVPTGYHPSKNIVNRMSLEYKPTTDTGSPIGQVIMALFEKGRNCRLTCRTDIATEYITMRCVDFIYDEANYGLNANDNEVVSDDFAIINGSIVGVENNGAQNTVHFMGQEESVSARYSLSRIGRNHLTPSGKVDCRFAGMDVYLPADGTAGIAYKSTANNRFTTIVNDPDAVELNASFSIAPGFRVKLPAISDRLGRISLAMDGLNYRFGVQCFDINGNHLHANDDGGASTDGRALVQGARFTRNPVYALEYLNGAYISVPRTFNIRFHPDVREVIIIIFGTNVKSVEATAFNLPGAQFYSVYGPERKVTAIPENGIWYRGDTVWIDDDTANDLMGWRVVTSGKSYGTSGAWSSGMTLTGVGQRVHTVESGFEVWELTDDQAGTAGTALTAAGLSNGDTYVDSNGNEWTLVDINAAAITEWAPISPGVIEVANDAAAKWNMAIYDVGGPGGTLKYRDSGGTLRLV